MAQPRLSTALSDGTLTLPEGRIAVLRPPMGYDIGDLPRDAVWIDHGFAPDHRFWSDSGYDVGTAPTGLAAVIVVVPRSKALARAMIARAATMAPMVIVDGQRTDGVDSLFKDLRKRFGDMSSVTKAHGRIFWFASPGAMPDWAATASATADGYVTQPGVFAEGGIDKGSAQLIAALPAKLPKTLADLGGGWGYLTDQVLKMHPNVESVDLVEAEALALDCARQNVTDPRANFHWADATTWRPTQSYGGIITNPPFHTSRAADPALGRAFIASAAKMLAKSGHLWLVANRHLPYEHALGDHFARVDEIGGDGGFKVFHAHRPKT